MKYSIIVLGAPYSSPSANTALNFTNALLSSGHTVFRVFFYHEGVQCANHLAAPPQDEINLPEQWQKLKAQHNLDLVACIAAGVKRGVLDQSEAKRHEKECSNLSQGFELSGLGQLVEATEQSDRVITFGP
ncbi:sulfurtransferase complex subunit TusD [Alkalimarinus sediminis]|uniref:Sulfurtransferase complex subunit TusD n=1 Tax=Alkalimarinus sediminis TaxID=1632866 RepID=A0A9E8KQP8_9ALTE|nr:sulfurtransferase complex subunit TusD [Alkalimarinus sediminis]UZW76099.1 sulfurtransferase complex subunit TusD [Alkalimarinus sediminis]